MIHDLNMGWIKQKEISLILNSIVVIIDSYRCDVDLTIFLTDMHARTLRIHLLMHNHDRKYVLKRFIYTSNFSICFTFEYFAVQKVSKHINY